MNASPASPPETPHPPVRVSRWWRALAYFLGLLLMLGVATTFSLYEQLKAQIRHLQTKVAQVPQVRLVSVLLDDQQRPAMLVTYNPQDGALLVQRLNDVKEGREDSMQLWASTEGAAPRSLGVIESKFKTLQMPVRESDLQGVTELAISAENKGGVPAGAAPSLPWLFKGWLVQKTI